MGSACLIRREGADAFERCVAAALFAQFLCILSFFALAQRYAADLYPFLIFCLIMFLRSGGSALVRSRHVIIGLVCLSIAVNSLATVSWLIGPDQNVPSETRAAWERFLGRHSVEKGK
jgi:4-amino-4-deoxy-L-arabinose transferase-like glycosyltransferase